MTKRDKRMAALRANPKGVRFEDACRIAESLGFEYQGGQGSHRTYGRFGEPTLLNFQNRAGYIKPIKPGNRSKWWKSMNPANKYLVEIFWSDEDEGFVAIAPDLPSCSAFGETQQEALHEMSSAMASWLEACVNMNRPYPEPKAKPQRLAA